MSNKDANGFELPWILVTEPCQSGTRSRIAVNPFHERAAWCDDAWALARAMEDAVVHHSVKAADAVMAHIRDAHKYD